MDDARDLAMALKDRALSRGDILSESKLLALCAATARGQAVANPSQASAIDTALAQLENSGLGYDSPAQSPALDGEWALVYASENPTRSSPFFWAFRELCRGVQQPVPGLPNDLSEALFRVTDGLPFASVGTATHTITGAGADLDDNPPPAVLTSRVQLSLRVMDAMVPPSVGFVTSVAHLEAIGPNEAKVTLLHTSVKDSTWRALPFLSGMDDVEFPAQQVFNGIRGGSATALIKTTYLSDQLRVTRVNDLTLVHLRQ